MTDTKVTCPGCDRKFNSVGTMTSHGRSIHWWSEKQIEAMKREHNTERVSMEKATAEFNNLLEAAEQVLWKLSHNHDLPDYKGPGRITREDATVRMLQAAVKLAKGA